MSSKKIIIVGTGGIAEVAKYYIEKGEDKVVAFSAHKRFIDRDRINGIPVISLENLNKLYDPGQYLVFIAIGYQKVNTIREKVLEIVRSKGYSIYTHISDLAIVADDVEIGYNCLISPIAIVDPSSKIGNNTFIRSGAYVGHHVVIEDNCWIGARSVVGGYSHIGRNTFVGYSGVIRDKTRIGERNIIGAGTFIRKNTGNNEVWTPPAAVKLNKDSMEVEI